MLPVLFSIGPVSVSSFGFFLIVGFLSALFVTWRIAKAYDLDEGKIFDFAIFTFLGGLIFARLVFVILNWPIFSNFFNIFRINLYPGFTFWGGLLGGIITLKLLTIRAKLNFWQISDLASVGLMIGLVFGSFGCFLSGCSYGIVSESLLALPVTGLIGKRFPISIIESIIFLIFFCWLWKDAIRFHFQGKIFSLALILLGLERFLTESYKGDSQFLTFPSFLYRGQAVSLLIIFIGIAVYYYRSKRNFVGDMKFIPQVFYVQKKRDLVIQTFSKTWYNTKVGWKIKLDKIRKKINVKPTPKNYQ